MNSDDPCAEKDQNDKTCNDHDTNQEELYGGGEPKEKPTKHEEYDDIQIDLLTNFKIDFFKNFDEKRVNIFRKILSLSRNRKLIQTCYLLVKVRGIKHLLINNKKFKSLAMFFTLLFNTKQVSCKLIKKMQHLFKKRFPIKYKKYFF